MKVYLAKKKRDYPSHRPRRKRFRKTRKFIKIATYTLFILAISAILILGVTLALSWGDIKLLESNQSPGNAQTTKVYATGDRHIASFHAEENREIIPLKDIPVNMQNAVIAIEDERFYHHSGIDIRGKLRALFVNISKMRVVEGGSTITEQYVKNALAPQERSFLRKIKEATLALYVEIRYDKKTILEKYLNTIYFGQGTYGVETAAQVYFGKHAKDLTLSECALMAGIPGSPNTFSPYKNPENAKIRRNIVLDKMVSLGYINRDETEEAKKEDIKVQELKTGEVQYAPYFVEDVKQYLIDKYGANMVFKGGLRVYTTLDLNIQTMAENAVDNSLDRPNDPWGALVAIDPKTGYVKALVGGKDFHASQFNIATQGHRQPGSAFKAFVLATALEEGVSPYKRYSAIGPMYIDCGDYKWRVTNYEGGNIASDLTIWDATVFSVNVVYAQLIKDVGPMSVEETAKDMGIKTKIGSNPAIALGGLEQGVSPLEMASAFGTLANKGTHCEPIYITKVTDDKGKILEENAPKERSVISERTANTETQILADVIRRGTATGANIGRPAAGKTGTTEYNQDAWFIGYTPDLVASVWIGYPEGSYPMSSVHGLPPVGGGMPAQIWNKFMSDALANVEPSDFPVKIEYKREIEEKTITVRVCADSGLLPTSSCPNVISKQFKRGEEPTEYCNIHRKKEEKQETGTKISVPSVIGMSESQATSSIKQTGLNVVKITAYNSQVPVGEVITQIPSPGDEVDSGTSVTITVSTGPPPPTTP